MIDWLDALASWVRDSGVLGLVAFSAVLVALALAMAPTLQMYIAAGTIYGVWWGALLTSVLSCTARPAAPGIASRCSLASPPVSARSR